MNLSYNISGKLEEYLSRIDKLRTDILLTPIPPKLELRLKWNAGVSRIYWALSLQDNPLSKADMEHLLSTTLGVPKKKRLSGSQKDVINQKLAANYIKTIWFVSKNQVTMATIKKLYDLACRETMGPPTGLTDYSEKRVNALLDYIQESGSEHPVVTAGLAQIELINITPFDHGNHRVARLLSYLILYKYGYDTREMISFEEIMKKDIGTYKRVLDLAKTQSINLWLEYFAFCIMTSLEKALEIAKSQAVSNDVSAGYWKISNRQRQILEYLERPGLRVTNKDLQKFLKISQITASRDLAKLTSLGLLLAHGKGRSVYYTRV